jgi:hypothetical protein
VDARRARAVGVCDGRLFRTAPPLLSLALSPSLARWQPSLLVSTGLLWRIEKARLHRGPRSPVTPVASTEVTGHRITYEIKDDPGKAGQSAGLQAIREWDAPHAVVVRN